MVSLELYDFDFLAAPIPDVKHHVAVVISARYGSTKKTEIPTHLSPSTIFTKIYVDVLYMPRAGKYVILLLPR